MSYYMPSPRPSHHSHSHQGHGPVMYNSSSGGGYLSPQPYDDGFGGGYGGYGGGQPYVVSTPSSRSRRHHSSQPHYHDSHRSSRSRHGGHSQSHGHRSHRHRSLGEKILRFFGFGRHRSRSHSRGKQGWSLFGNNNRHRARYMDSRSGVEVDRSGRPVYKV